jgi:hypothetical protein
MQSDDEDTGVTRSNRWAKLTSSRSFRVACGTALTVGLAAGGYGIAYAATGTGSPPTQKGAPNFGHWFGGARPTVAGTVGAVGTNSFTIKGHNGATTTVDVSSSTTYEDHGVAHPTLANVKSGAFVAVAGSSSSGTVHATSVMIGQAMGRRRGGQGGFGRFGGARPAAAGTVGAVGTKSFTLKGHNGTTTTVDVTSTTTYEDQGVSHPTLANVKAGAFVAVTGSSSSGTVHATSVMIGGPGGGSGHGAPGPSGGTPGLSGGTHWFGGGSPPAAVGTVGNVGANTFTVKGFNGTTTTVDVSSSTTYKDTGTASPSVSDLKAGDFVVVTGSSSSGTVHATSVMIGGPGGPGGGGGYGGPGGFGGHGTWNGGGGGPGSSGGPGPGSSGGTGPGPGGGYPSF